MTRHNRFIVIGCVAVLSTSVEPAASSPMETIVLQDEVRTAFYEHAPSEKAQRMAHAVKSYCAASSQAPTAPAWLCSQAHLKYLINVSLTGETGSHGLVCEDVGTLKLKYFGVDLVPTLIADHTCLSVECNDKAFHIVLPQVRASGDN